MAAATALDVDLKRVFALQKETGARLGPPGVAERIEKLKRLREAIERRTADLVEALAADLKKPETESLLTEVFPVTTEIRHACRNLHRWTRSKRVFPPLVFLGSRNSIRHEPKGVVLVLAPWNFPLQLTLGPLVSALAAGNRAILKPSEVSAHTSRVVKALVSEVFDEREVAVFEGDAAVARALLDLPFDHVFFTGSPAVGKLVMAAAAKHLTSVTLELGGKCPAILDRSADFPTAARKIAWGKFLNAGQVCLAPDYVLLPEEKLTAFVGWLKEAVQEHYGPQGEIAGNKDYCRIISQKHSARLKGLLDSALSRGARCELGGVFADDRLITPTIVTDVPLDSDLMQEEIFGPVLPVLGYRELQDALDVVNERSHPLALYIFSRDRRSIDQVLSRTVSGDVVINDVVVHFANVALPFGGARTSGIGKSHGYHGFQAFSRVRSVMKQPRRTLLELLYPPYRPWVKRLVQLLIRFF